MSNPNDALIFVSCGQRTPAEIRLGSALKNAIDAQPGFRAYFAQHGGELETLTNSIFGAARDAVGAVIALHEREPIADGGNACRASAWVSQELAVLAFRAIGLADRIPVLVFKEPNVSLEGVLGTIHANPKPMPAIQDIRSQIEVWIGNEVFPNSTAALFHSIWQQTTDDGKLALKALIEAGGVRVPEENVGRSLREREGIEINNSVRIVTEERERLRGRNLIDFEYTLDGYKFWTLKQAFSARVRYELRAWELARTQGALP